MLLMDLIFAVFFWLFLIGAALFWFLGPIWYPDLFDYRARSYYKKFKDSGIKNIPVNGIEFEYWVSSYLRGRGWSTRVTQSTGDQGIDVIASKSGYAFGIQCKRVSKPCSNKAVQEVISGGLFYGIKNLAVVSTAGFTEGAHQLARRSGVVLLYPDELPALCEIVNNSLKAQSQP